MFFFQNLGYSLAYRGIPLAPPMLVQAKNLVLLAGDDESQWLVDVDLLLQVTIEEGGLDIHVVHMLTHLGC